MYKNLRGEMFARKISIKNLAKKIGVAEKTLRNKLNGTTDFTFQEAIAIRKEINENASLEHLFSTDEEDTPTMAAGQ